MVRLLPNLLKWSQVSVQLLYSQFVSVPAETSTEWLLGVGRSFGATETRILNVDGGVDMVQLSELH